MFEAHSAVVSGLCLVRIVLVAVLDRWTPIFVYSNRQLAEVR